MDLKKANDSVPQVLCGRCYNTARVVLTCILNMWSNSCVKVLSVESRIAFDRNKVASCYVLMFEIHCRVFIAMTGGAAEMWRGVRWGTLGWPVCYLTGFIRL